MSIYRDKVLPRIIDKACSSASIGRWRARAVEGLSGVIVEPGFGSGTNVPHYPDEVTRVFAVDPALLGRELAADRVAASPVEVEFIGLDGQTIPLDDNTCDAGLLTFTLCTIPDPLAALAELRRVIKPGGSLHLLEHGRSDDERVCRWQHRIDPIQRRLFDGCHVSRNHRKLLTSAGFEIDWYETGYADGPKPWSFFHLGVATNPASDNPGAGC